MDATDQRCLAALADGAWHSGTRLAEALGLSRAALAKRLSKLNAADIGLHVQSRHGLGYRIEGGLDLLTDGAGTAHPALVNYAGLSILQQCDSTNTWLGEHPDFRVALAEYQSQGRGRRGRSWQAPYGQNLMLSLRHRYPHWPDHLPALSLVLGLAVVRCLDQAGIPARIKWPNDIWLAEAKLAGLLVETRGEVGSGCELIVGLGLNVNMCQASSIDQAWTSLKLAGFRSQRAELAAGLIDALGAALQGFARQDLRTQLSDYPRFDALQDRPICIHDGGRTDRGHYRGIDENGAIRVALDSGCEQSYVVGDVSVRTQTAH